MSAVTLSGEMGAEGDMVSRHFEYASAVRVGSDGRSRHTQRFATVEELLLPLGPERAGAQMPRAP